MRVSFSETWRVWQVRLESLFLELLCKLLSSEILVSSRSIDNLQSLTSSDRKQALIGKIFSATKEMESAVVPSPGGSSSPITRGIAAGSSTPTVPLYLSLSRDLQGFDVTFAKSEGFFRKETDEVPRAVAGVHDEYGLITVVPTPEAPQSEVLEATGTSRLDKLYEPDFQRLERGLLAARDKEKTQAIQHDGSPPALMMSNGQEKAQAIRHQASHSVTEGKVAELGVVGVGAGGELVFGTELGNRKAGNAK